MAQVHSFGASWVKLGAPRGVLGMSLSPAILVIITKAIQMLPVPKKRRDLKIGHLLSHFKKGTLCEMVIPMTPRVVLWLFRFSRHTWAILNPHKQPQSGSLSLGQGWGREINSAARFMLLGSLQGQPELGQHLKSHYYLASPCHCPASPTPFTGFSWEHFLAKITCTSIPFSGSTPGRYSRSIKWDFWGLVQKRGGTLGLHWLFSPYPIPLTMPRSRAAGSWSLHSLSVLDDEAGDLQDLWWLTGCLGSHELFMEWLIRNASWQ